MSSRNTLVEHVAEQIVATTAGTSFGRAVALVEQLNDSEGFDVGGHRVRLTDVEFHAAVELVLAWHHGTHTAPTEYLGCSAVARDLGVPRPTLASWLRRYRHAATPPPAPDGVVVEPSRVRPGWSRPRVRQMRDWMRYDLPGLRRTGGWSAGRPRQPEAQTDA